MPRDTDRQIMKITAICALVSVAVAAILLLVSLLSRQSTSQVFLGGQAIEVRVVDTPEQRARGLSGTESLAPNEGMLFVFDTMDKHGIWMKEMNYSLDIIWLNEEKQIVHIEEAVHPDTYPKVFHSDKPAKYVLELPSGFVEENNVKPQQQLLF